MMDIQQYNISDRFYTEMNSRPTCRMAEIGVKGWDGRSGGVTCRDRVPNADWVGIDMLEGSGVDVVADVQSISKNFSPGYFNGIVMVAVLEHVAKPWIAAQELAAITRLNGWILVGSHQSFPYHPYPQDYWRFSKEALAELFCPAAGWEVIDSQYNYPCKILPLVDVQPWNFVAESWLNVSCIARKIR